MKTRFKKAIPLIATTVLATTALTTQTLFNVGGNQQAEAQLLSKEERQPKPRSLFFPYGSMPYITIPRRVNY